MSDETPKKSERVAIINAVKSYLGFFVLVVLIVEVVLGAVALNTQGTNQLVALFGMLLVIIALIAVVSFFAYHKPDALLQTAQMKSENPVENFSKNIAGYWWEAITPNETSSISFVEVRFDSVTGTVKMKGKGYNKTGQSSSVWQSVASCINPNERKVFYYWKGWHIATPNETYEGFGEILFDDAKPIEHADGFFSDTNLADMKSTTRKTVVFRRCSPEDIEVMLNGSNSAITELTHQKTI